jgi:hypothetical protein
LDFVTIFAAEGTQPSIAEPFHLSDEKKDAVLAGVIETLSVTK